MIETFVAGRQSTDEVERFLETILDGSEKDLILQFLTDPNLVTQRAKIRYAINKLTEANTKEEAKAIEHFIAGFIFERIALIYLNNLINQENSKESSRRKILLLPEDLEEISKRIYGSSAMESIHGLYTVMQGKTMPDAIEIRDAAKSLELVRIVEATAGDINMALIVQARLYKKGVVQTNLLLDEEGGGIRLGNLISQIRPDIQNKPVNTAQCRLVFLSPIGSNLYQGGYSRIEVPITRRSIAELTSLCVRGGF